jgi:uncharacterized protein YjiS (DUF1127 family)
MPTAQRQLDWHHLSGPQPSNQLKQTDGRQRSTTGLAYSGGAPHALLSSGVGLLSSLFKSVQRSLAIAQNRRVLQGIPDNALKDIGISRSEIDSIVLSAVDDVPDLTRRLRGRF